MSSVRMPVAGHRHQLRTVVHRRVTVTDGIGAGPPRRGQLLETHGQPTKNGEPSVGDFILYKSYIERGG